ncbi:MAG: hypothetical protein V4683_19385, partial [Bacteroidota bacterium]
TNNGNGDIFYISSMGAGTGLNSFSVGGHSISTNSINGYGLRATSSTNYPIVGLSDNAANTLAAIRAFNIGGGPGVHASSAVENGVFGTSGGAGKSGLRGEASATNGMGAYGLATNSTGIGVSGNNTAGGDGVLGTSTTGYGVRGVTNSATGFAGVHGTNNGTAGSGVVGISHIINTQGVYGSSNNGIGIRGASENFRAISGTANSGTAIYGNSSSGTALYGSSTSGYALETLGNVKISGGNTNPANGAVLTSDASGNAVWKKDNKIAFFSDYIVDDYKDVPSDSEWKLLFSNEIYDYSNNFDPYISGTPTQTSGTFLAPVNGLYHFDIKVDMRAGPIDDIAYSHMILRRQRGNSITDIATADGFMVYNASISDFVQFQISKDAKLQTGDKIWVILWHDSDLNSDARILNDYYFDGHLVFEE